MNLKEIARAAGVSQSTVTMVLHDRKGVSQSTRECVQALLEENGYSVKKADGSPSVQTEAEKIVFIKFKRFSFMVDGNAEYINLLFDEVESCCNQAGYEIAFRVATPETLPDIFEKVNTGPFKGIILLGTEFSDEDRPLLNRVKKPIIIIDNDLTKLSVTSVSNHTWNSMRTKVTYLLGRGHRQIGYIRNSQPTSICTQCYLGFLNAMEQYHLKVEEKYIYDVYPSIEGACSCMKGLLDKGIELPSALVSNSDIIAIGAMKAFREYGIRVPEQVSIIGADNIMSGMVCVPQLTTCEVYAKDIGKWAVKLLCDRIENPASPVIRLRIDTTIVERDSVCDYADHVPYQRG